jgi:ubiquinone/menaquinone biosynthesis C-methylase UbiE
MSYPQESYESHMVPALFGPWASQLVQRANPQPGEQVLDVACGTGITARHIVPHLGSSGRVVGLDFNLNMIRVGRAAAERESRAIVWVQGRAEQLGIVDGYFDLVTCQFGLMLFPDRPAALSEMRRVLRKGGRLVLSVWQGLDRHPFFQTLHEVSKQRLWTSGVESAFSLGDSGELRRYLTDAGFQDVEVEPVSITARFPNPQEFLDWEIDVDPLTVPALLHLDPQAQHAVMDSIRRDMQAPLRELMQGDQVLLPSHAHIARARR